MLKHLTQQNSFWGNMSIYFFKSRPSTVLLTVKQIISCRWGHDETRCLRHVHRRGDWACRCPTRAVAQKSPVGENGSPCDTGSSMRSLTGSQMWGCQRVHVMSLELPPQQWSSIRMCPQLHRIIQGPSEPKGSLEGAHISGSSASPPYLNIDVRSPRL